MKFTASQHFEHPVDQLFELFASGAAASAMPALGALSRPEVLEIGSRGTDRVVAVRVRLTARLPPAATAIVDPERLSWVEETTYNTARRVAAVRFRPDHYADRLKASASVRFDDVADGRCTREVAGEVSVKALLVGGQVERVIVGDLRDYLAAERDVVAEILAG